MADLSPQFNLYHGTFRDLEGGVVKPAVETPHKRTNFSVSNRAKAYATTSEDIAWSMARFGRRGRQDANDMNPGRTRVHTVEPHPDMTHGEHESLAEYVAPEFEVSGVIDIQPGRQGTFPLNWDQFAKEPSYTDAYNHPTDTHLDGGHGGLTEDGRRHYQERNAPSLAAEVNSKIERGQGRLF